MMSIKILWVSGLMLFCAMVAANPVVPAKQLSRPVSAPPRKCEIRHEAWCIYQDGSEITDLQKVTNENPNEHIWTMRDVYHPQSVLVIFEPDGCRNGLADTVDALGFDKDVKWQGKAWDQMRVRLKVDGSCDLRLLVPLFDKNPLEWAFSVGRTLIAACGDEKCTGMTPTPADVTEKYREQFKR
jgi:hypothetical protein